MAALEGATALAHGSVEKLSEQNIVDCSREFKLNQDIVRSVVPVQLYSHSVIL